MTEPTPSISTPPAATPSDPQVSSAALPPDNHTRNKWLLRLTGLIILIGLVWLILYLVYFQYYESTDDAYSNGNMINLNSAVAGSVVAIFADDTDLVEEGQLLVQLDKTAYLIKYEQSLAALSATVLQVRQLYENVKASRATFENRTVALARARYDYDNRAKLVDSQAIAKEDFVHSKDDVALAKTAQKEAEAKYLEAVAAAGNTPLEEHPLLKESKSAVRVAFYNLKHTSIFAPNAGYIAQRLVNVGQWVNPGTPMMAIIPTDYVWVDANFKETQLTNMRVGQPAEVYFDMYGSKIVYKGKVLGIASGSGSVFSLIPPQNATGNWIKIVQRLPVRISLDPETVKKYPVRLGISAEVSVDISNQDLPMLVQKPSTNPIATTDVFDIDMQEVNKIIDQIIQANSAKPEA
jgi:membrane fusion protein (multidrug efflux system)